MRQKAKETAIREDRQDEEPEKEIPWIKREGHKDTLRKLKHGRNHHRYTNEFPERVKSQVLVPSSIPYTTAASVFVYGASAVEAALRCSRRKLYKLYIYQAEGEELTTQQNLLRKMALAQGVTVKMAFASWDTMMTKMSDGRPHNGFVLEASPLPTLPIASLEPVTDPTANVFHVKLNPQSEEEAKVNGSSNEVQRAERYDEAARSRFPLILLVDGIVDPGNIGAIIRSAYYLGVDGIVYAGRNSAPMSPVTAKASAGATESMTFLKTVNPQEFVQASRKNGWRFLAADSPRNVFERSSDVISVDRAAGTNTTSLLTEAPTVLMLGNEGTGLMERLKVRADGLISIPGAHFRHQEGILNDAAGVDSLNVSVAAAMLIEMLMRTPLQVTDLPALERQEKEKEKEKETPPPSEAQEAVPQEVAPQSFDFN
jgi:23S rRNA (guanosine2251-2'-O)-methyltransferase/21S rRNA (GM2251-2'-O)-methyltransferase